VTPALELRPIGVIHTPFQDRAEAPRQPRAALGVEGTVELFSSDGIEHALEDLEAWSHVWLLFWFHLNEGWRPKVMPPRSTRRRGVLSTRAPYRPNPIGLSVVELVRVRGLVLDVKNVDMLDGSPLIDIKPYVAYTDAIPGAGSGWLEPDDPGVRYDVVFDEAALVQAAYLRERFSLELVEPITRVLELGPQPHAYRRIKHERGVFRLAVKEWRAQFRVDGTCITVLSLGTGYRPRELADPDNAALEAHREFVARFGWTDASVTVHPDR
jgi:tRNA (adenine37-N6)-methyltransferase